MKRRIVSDASPLIALAKIDCLGLLFVSFSEIHIPNMVFREATVESLQKNNYRLSNKVIQLVLERANE